MSAQGKSELRTKIFGETVAVRANWTQAGSQVERLADAKDGIWESTGRQVSGYRHSDRAALREELEALADGSDCDCSSEIEIALRNAVESDA